MVGLMLSLDTLASKGMTLMEDVHRAFEQTAEGRAGNETSDVIFEDDGESFLRFPCEDIYSFQPNDEMKSGKNLFASLTFVFFYIYICFWQKTFRSRRKSSQAECVNTRGWRWR